MLNQKGNEMNALDIMVNLYTFLGLIGLISIVYTVIIVNKYK